MNRKEILKGISDEADRPAAAKAMDRLELAVKTYTPQFTDFMDPYKAHSIKDMLSGGDCEIIVYGGYADSERVKIGFFPEFTVPDEKDFEIVPVEISYKRQFSRELTHRDFLGSILGLGITREKTGDIIVEESRAIAFTDIDIADYIVINLERVGHTKVNVKITENFVPKTREAAEKRFTVPSLRLDAVLGGALNISRGRTAEYIKGEKVFINWKKEISVSHTVKEGDMITLRGMGRVKINEIIGNTKKDRILLSVLVYR